MVNFLNLNYFTTCEGRQKPDKLFVTYSHKIISDSRGGVEDPTFEAKKSKKKSPRPRTDFSRTDPLKAKDRNARSRVVNGPTISGPNPARIRKYKPEPEN